ncbi:VWA domain-containing protein [Luteolibacter arcticus]|uniref:VWA domain-containing protein n=1 Tax=Luteolibacter arcticus TaxID=1581411 RepID=A0ABT3GGH4_9BACT|nr:Amuc_1099 family pilus-like system protein [Luteolibacter arcticus]MCW1922722.1 VWA domain-containing protein [Luteolibacter arcticus]
MNPSEDPNDRLLDSLLREQARRGADEELLQAIDARLDAGKVPAHRRRRSSRAMIWSAAAAAVVVLSVGVITWQTYRLPDRPELVMDGSVALSEPPMAKLRDPAVEAHMRMADESGSARRIASSSSAEFLLPDVAPAAPASPLAEAPIEEAIPQEIAALDAAPAPAAGLGLGGGAGGGRGRGIGTGSGPASGPGRQGGLAEKETIRRARLTPEELKASGAHVGADAVLDKSGPNELSLVPSAPPVPGKGKGVKDDGMARENYGRLVDQPWKSPWQDALSTFSIDVDTASYTNVRRMLLDGRTVPADAVRIEELVNYFDYRYEGPKGDGPFAVHGTLATCPWKPQHLLARVAIKGREIDAKARPASNLVFLIDVSGSMQDPAKLPLLKRSMRILLDQLDERDRLGIVVYAGSEGVVLEPTTLDERGLSAAIQALEKLEAGGSTNGGAGIKRAYEMAAKHLVAGGVNRVILATDGDFNVGTTGQGDLVKLVKEGAAKGMSLSVVGFGTGNLNDAMLEAITNDGNGNYFYIDGDHEARRVFLQKLTGTLVTIAKDVKIQVEFNPGKVQAYRLIGYANRILRHEDFNNDKVDAGDIGAGHTVTAFYEIVPPGVAMPDTGKVDGLRYQKPAEKETVASDDWLTLKLRYKHPEGEVSSLIESPLKGEPQPWEKAGHDFRFASAVALFGMKLRQMSDVSDMPWQKVVEIARPAVADDPREQRSEFVEMVARHGRFPLPPVMAEEAAPAPIPMPVAGVDALAGLRYLNDESIMWYVQFGLESGGKWAPRFIGLTPSKKKLQNRVSAVEMLSLGDTFFREGEFANRFKFTGFEERELRSERTGLTQRVKIAIYEDLKPNKAGAKYESQAGLPDAELESKAYYDRSAVLKSGDQEVLVEEQTMFKLPGDPSGKEYLLKKVTPQGIVVEAKAADGKVVTVEIPKGGGE